MQAVEHLADSAPKVPQTPLEAGFEPQCGVGPLRQAVLHPAGAEWLELGCRFELGAVM